MEMTVIGNPVNLASKLENMNKVFNSSVSTTKKLLSEAEEQGYVSENSFTEALKVSVSGLSQSMDVMYVEKPKKLKKAS